MDNKSKRANPLTDLVDSEKIFVDQLTGIIRVCCYYPALDFFFPKIITSS
jgi:hypothetical protein